MAQQTTGKTGAGMNEGKRSAGQGAAAGIMDQAKDVAGAAGERMRDATQRAGELASDVQRRASDAVSAVGEYVQELDFANLADDLAGVIRRYPIPSVLVGIGIGFLIAKATRS